MKLVTAAVIIRDNKVLLTRRKCNEKLAGYWEFPGGKIEKDESPRECLERELMEELGIESEAADIIAESEYYYEHGAFKIIAMLTTIANGDFDLKVHDRAEWVPIHQLLKYQLSPADIPIARVVMSLNSAVMSSRDGYEFTC